MADMGNILLCSQAILTSNGSKKSSAQTFKKTTGIEALRTSAEPPFGQAAEACLFRAQRP
jgi:hypothetical protein